MTDIIKRSIRVAESAAAVYGRAEDAGLLAGEAAGAAKTASEARTVAEELRRLHLLELLQEAFEHLVEDISHDITPDESDELATKIDEALRDAGYFETVTEGT